MALSDTHPLPPSITTSIAPQDPPEGLSKPSPDPLYAIDITFVTLKGSISFRTPVLFCKLLRRTILLLPTFHILLLLHHPPGAQFFSDDLVFLQSNFAKEGMLPSSPVVCFLLRLLEEPELAMALRLKTGIWKDIFDVMAW